MKKNHLWKASATLAASALLLTGCAANEGAGDATTTPASGGMQSASTGLAGTFSGAGASAQEAAQAAWIAAFQTSNPDVTINYNPVGSGAGRTQFIEGATVYAGSDSYIKDEELAGSFARCAPDTAAIDLPIYISPIAVVFNIDGVDALNVDATTLAKIFKGDITSWDDAAIKALNPQASLPSAPITVVHRSDDSGTTDNFTDYLAATAPTVWDKEASDTFPYSFAGAEGAQGTSGVISAVTSGKNTIGYADASKAGSLATAALQVGDTFVSFTPEAAAAVVDASPLVEGRAANDLAIAIDRNTTAEGAYPLVLVSYLIVCETYADAKDAEFAKAYASFVASEAGQLAAQAGAGSAPISEQTRAAVVKAINTIK